MGVRKFKSYPSQQEIKAKFDYNPETGDFCHKGTDKIASISGYKKTNPFVNMSGERYQLKRMIWIYMTGEDPMPAFVQFKSRADKSTRWDNITINRLHMEDSDEQRRKLTVRRAGLKRTFGLSLEDYLEMKRKQEDKCKICKTFYTRTDLAVDHCHKTGKIRGLLCNKCNNGLGCYSDNIELMYAAIDYLCEYDSDLQVIRDKKKFGASTYV